MAVLSARNKKSVPGGRVLVVAAWAPELARLRRIFAREPGLGRRVVLETLGVGLVAAAAGTGRVLDRHRPSCVVLVGTCGAYGGAGRGNAGRTRATSHHRPGGVIAVRKAVLADLGVARQLAYYPAVQPVQVTPRAALVRTLRRVAGIADAVCACPLAITRDARTGRQLARAAAADVENLEVFAVAHASRAAGIPFAAVLGIANQVGPHGHTQWRQNGAAAAAAACEAVALWLRETTPPRTRPAASRGRPHAGKARRSRA